jgi:hypothetical protein
MAEAKTKSELSSARRRLVQAMQAIGFGRVRGLRVRAGEPVLSGEARIEREVRVGLPTGARHERELRDLEFKAAHRDLFALLSEAGDAVVECLEVRDGLPYRVTFRGAI